MKLFKIGKKIHTDHNISMYKFRVLFLGFIPMKIICDWNSNLCDKGYMIKKYLLFNIIIYQKKHKITVIQL